MTAPGLRRAVGACRGPWTTTFPRRSDDAAIVPGSVGLRWGEVIVWLGTSCEFDDFSERCVG